MVRATIGAEGLNTVHGQHILIADTANDVVRAIMRLQADPALIGTLTDRAYQLLVERYAWDASGRMLGQAMAEMGLPARGSV